MLLKPNCYSTHAAIGFCEVLIGETRKAVESFHKALALKRDDTFSSTMLSYVLDLHVQEAKDANEVAFDFSSIDKMDGKVFFLWYKKIQFFLESAISNESSASDIFHTSSLMEGTTLSDNSFRSSRLNFL